MSRTTVTPHMRCPMEVGQNIVYCATFQLAWNELLKILNGPLVPSEPAPAVEALNEQLQTSADVDPADSYSHAGFTRDGVLETIRSEMQRRFQKEATLPENADGIVFYAFLRKALEFALAFQVAERGLAFNGGPPVRAFGCWSDQRLLEQLEIVDFAGHGDFILRLHHTAGDADELIVACVPPQPTLLETVELVGERVAAGDALGPLPDKRLESTERFQMPEVSLDVEHQFGELIGVTLCNPGYVGWFISEAKQLIALTLNERGATLESEGIGVVSRSMPMRQFVVDRPFLVWMRKKGQRYPYLALWVENAEVLKPPHP